MKMNLSVSVVIVTYNGKEYLPECLPSLINSPLKPRVLIVDSSSSDGTVEEAERLGAETLVIRKELFNHGATREMARKYLGTDIVVMMTQDAYPLHGDLLEKLIDPIIQGKSSFSYARQIHRNDADIFEAFSRLFNYPDKSNTRSIQDINEYGVYTFFCSNSCAAYLNSALDEIGGFKPILTNEDYFAAARMLMEGHTVAYVAEAEVMHSHNYSIWQEFKRYFDTGYVRAENPWVADIVGHAESRGKVFFVKLLKEIYKLDPLLIPSAILYTFTKWLGYRIGYLSVNAPLWWKKTLSSQGFYWDSVHHR